MLQQQLSSTKEIAAAGLSVCLLLLIYLFYLFLLAEIELSSKNQVTYSETQLLREQLRAAEAQRDQLDGQLAALSAQLEQSKAELAEAIKQVSYCLMF